MTAATLEHVYRPQGGCAALWACRDDEVLISGPAGTGKSRAALEKVHAVMLANPGARALIVRKRAVDLPSSALATFETQVIVEALSTGMVAYFGGSSREPPGYRYTNGSRVNLGGLDRPTKIMSTEYDVIYVQEAIELTETDWESCSIRLRHGRVSFQQLLADTNPDTPTHWLNQRCVRGATTLIESRHEDNPTITNPDGSFTERGRAYIARLDALTGVRLHRYRHGLWVAAEGVIWEDYDPAVHLIDRHPIPDDWPRWWVVDFGYRNPFVCQWWAQDPDGGLVRYRELYMTGRIVQDHAAQIMDCVTVACDPGRPDAVHVGGRWRRWTEPTPRAVITDHDAEDRATLERGIGRGTRAADKRVKFGLDAVADAFRAGRLRLMRDSLIERDPDLAERKLPTCTEEEIPGYVWDTTGQSADKRAPKEHPLKVNDHGADCVRYLVVHQIASAPRNWDRTL